jgi:hypothetical protein
MQHSQGSETKEKLGEDGFPNAEELERRSRHAKVLLMMLS